MEASDMSTSTSTSASMPALQQSAPRSPVPHSLHLTRPTSSTRTPADTSGPSSVPASTQQPTSSDVWAGAIGRVQQQVAYNTSMLESNRRQMHDMDQAIRRLHTEFGHAVGVINDFRVELRETRHRSLAKEPPVKHDSGDLDVLANQIAVITSKANEVEGLKMQLELMKNRLKRMEESAPLSVQKPDSSSAIVREQALLEAHHPAHQQHSFLQQPLPPLRAGALSSRDERAPAQHHHHLQQRPHTTSQGPSPYLSSSDPRHYAVEVSHASPPQNSLRTADSTLQRPATLSGWRPEEAASKMPVQSSSLPTPPSGATSSMPPLPHTISTDRQSSGWASVNQQSLKRSFDDQRQSPHEAAHMLGSPKRTKLAPIMPRESSGEERYPTHQPPLAKVLFDDRSHVRSSAPAEGSLHLTKPLAAPLSTSMNTYRSIPSSQHVEVQDLWQSASDHAPVQSPGRGGRGRGRGIRARGRPREGINTSHHHAREEHIGSRGEEGQWQTSPIARNGHHDPTYVLHTSPGRSGIVRRSGGFAGGQLGREHLSQAASGEYPPPTVYGVQDPFQQGGGSSKKSRTKPIRNSDGILIRKDGRPDMRSVSSANNLRKVHAKKEAERTEAGGRTPTSAAAEYSQSPEDEHHARDRVDSTPAPSRDGRGDGADGLDQPGSESRTRELMNEIFPQGYDGLGRPAEAQSLHMPHDGGFREMVLKTETLDADEETHESPHPGDAEPQATTIVSEIQRSRAPEAKITVIAESTEV